MISVKGNGKGKRDCLQMLKDMLKAKNLFGKKNGNYVKSFMHL